MDANISDPVDPRVHRVLAGVSRVQVLEVLREHGRALTVTDVAERVGLHPNTVRLHLDHMVEAGLATREREHRDRPGRPRLLYAATAVEPGRGGRGGQGGYRLLAEILASRLEDTSPQPGEIAAAAGRTWGADLARTLSPADRRDAGQATEHMVALLDGLGFAPRSADAGQTIALHRCPFLQVAEKHAQVVCGVHLGLMQGAFAELDAPVQITRLDPFVAAGLCLARLAPVPAGSHA